LVVNDDTANHLVVDLVVDGVNVVVYVVGVYNFAVVEETFKISHLSRHR
jgi:hypothetical protein